METIIVLLIVAVAFFFVSRNLYRQFKGKGNCSSGCSCTPEIKQHCSGTPPFLDDPR